MNDVVDYAEANIEIKLDDPNEVSNFSSSSPRKSGKSANAE